MRCIYLLTMLKCSQCLFLVTVLGCHFICCQAAVAFSIQKIYNANILYNFKLNFEKYIII